MKIKVPITDQEVVLDKNSIKAAAPAIAVIVVLGIVDSALRDISSGMTKTVIESGVQAFKFLKNKNS